MWLEACHIVPIFHFGNVTHRVIISLIFIVNLVRLARATVATSSIPHFAWRYWRSSILLAGGRGRNVAEGERNIHVLSGEVGRKHQPIKNVAFIAIHKTVAVVNWSRAIFLTNSHHVPWRSRLLSVMHGFSSASNMPKKRTAVRARESNFPPFFKQHMEKCKHDSLLMVVPIECDRLRYEKSGNLPIGNGETKKTPTERLFRVEKV